MRHAVIAMVVAASIAGVAHAGVMTGLHLGDRGSILHSIDAATLVNSLIHSRIVMHSLASMVPTPGAFTLMMMAGLVALRRRKG